VIGSAPDSNGLIMAITAFVVSPRYPEDEILARCKSLMPEHMIPEKVVTLAELPLNPNGKTDYAALAKNEFYFTSRISPT
jgi:acyl-CoA synthetase (AMP-forming)/AMP-acid ligase II